MPRTKISKKNANQTTVISEQKGAVSASEQIEQLRAFTHAMIHQLEKELRQEFPYSEDEITLLQRKREWLFGPKSSLVSTLVVLTDLVIKLDRSLMQNNPQELVLENIHESSVKPEDVALVQEFIRRSQFS